MQFVALLALVAALAAEDFTPLFNGKDLDGLKVEVQSDKPDAAFVVKDGLLVVTGKATGYIHTEKPFSEYSLRYEWKFPRPETLAKDDDFKGNSGCLLHIQPPQQVWPTCVEVQGLNRDPGNTFGVGSKFAGKLNKDARAKAMKPVGEWNKIEITCTTIADDSGRKRGKIVTKLNGVEVCSGEGDLTEGAIGWQSEGAEVHYRNIEIKVGK